MRRIRTCTLPGCRNREKARGLCSTHYDDARRRGDFVPQADADPERGTSRLVDDLGASFRKVDYWIRKGYCPVETALPGSGTRRQYSDDERRGIIAVADAYRQIDALHETIRSGEVYRRAVENADRWDARERLATTDPALTAALIELGDRYGPTGVAIAARDLVDGWTVESCT